MKPIPMLSHDQVRAHRGACIHPARSPAQADVFELVWEDRPAILKDFTARPWLIRRTWGRSIAGREANVLHRLEGVSGVPGLIGMAGPEALLMERLDAVRLPRNDEPPPPARFWRDARRLIEDLHRRGIAHGDLRRLNLMIAPDGRACLIDFATAMLRRDGGWTSWPRNFIYERCRQIDRVTLARLKSCYAAELLDEDDMAWLDAEPWFLRVGRWLKKNVIRWRKPRHWRRLGARIKARLRR